MGGALPDAVTATGRVLINGVSCVMATVPVASLAELSRCSTGTTAKPVGAMDVAVMVRISSDKDAVAEQSFSVLQGPGSVASAQK